MDDLLGLITLVAYVIAILALSAGVTYLVIRISPSQSAKEQADKGSS